MRKSNWESREKKQFAAKYSPVRHKVLGLSRGERRERAARKSASRKILNTGLSA